MSKQRKCTTRQPGTSAQNTQNLCRKLHTVNEMQVIAGAKLKGSVDATAGIHVMILTACEKVLSSYRYPQYYLRSGQVFELLWSTSNMFRWEDGIITQADARAAQ